MILSRNRLLIFVFSCLFLVAVVCFYPGLRALARDDGQLTVHNDSDKNVYIVIADKNAGPVDAGFSGTFSCDYGQHRVLAEYDGGYIRTYITITRSNPHAEWYIKKDDIRD